MPFKIIRNDITKMNTEAIVNTANDHAAVGTGCDSAVYEAAGYQELLEYRKKHIGFVVASDIHGSAEHCGQLLAAWEREKSDRLLLLGDLL